MRRFNLEMMALLPLLVSDRITFSIPNVPQKHKCIHFGKVFIQSLNSLLSVSFTGSCISELHPKDESHLYMTGSVYVLLMKAGL